MSRVGFFGWVRVGGGGGGGGGGGVGVCVFGGILEVCGSCVVRGFG